MIIETLIKSRSYQNELNLYSKYIRELDNECYKCGTVYVLGNLPDEPETEKRLAVWKTNHSGLINYIGDYETLKRRLPVCPECGCGIILHMP